MTAGGRPAASPHAQHDDLWDRAGSEAAAEVSSVLDTAQGLGIRWKGLDLGRQTHSPHTEGHGRNIRQGSASTCLHCHQWGALRGRLTQATAFL